MHIQYIRTNLKALSVSVGDSNLWNEVDSNLRNKTIILLLHFFQKRCTINVYYNIIYVDSTYYDITDWESWCWKMFFHVDYSGHFKYYVLCRRTIATMKITVLKNYVYTYMKNSIFVREGLYFYSWKLLYLKKVQQKSLILLPV